MTVRPSDRGTAVDVLTPHESRLYYSGRWHDNDPIGVPVLTEAVVYPLAPAEVGVGRWAVRV